MIRQQLTTNKTFQIDCESLFLSFVCFIVLWITDVCAMFFLNELILIHDMFGFIAARSTEYMSLKIIPVWCSLQRVSFIFWKELKKDLNWIAASWVCFKVFCALMLLLKQIFNHGIIPSARRKFFTGTFSLPQVQFVV